jgi:hypothetical protein
MTSREVHVRHLRTAEGQFRLATAVRLAVTFERQPLDLPLEWSHGKQRVRYSEVVLSREESDLAAWNLQRSATLLMASAALEAIRATTANPKTHSDHRVTAAYQIARMIRNAFAHNHSIRSGVSMPTAMIISSRFPTSSGSTPPDWTPRRSTGATTAARSRYFDSRTSSVVRCWETTSSPTTSFRFQSDSTSSKAISF